MPPKSIVKTFKVSALGLRLGGSLKPMAEAAYEKAAEELERLGPEYIIAAQDYRERRYWQDAELTVTYMRRELT